MKESQENCQEYSWDTQGTIPSPALDAAPSRITAFPVEPRCGFSTVSAERSGQLPLISRSLSLTGAL